MNQPGLTNQFLTSNIFNFIKKFGFSECFTGLTNNWLGLKRSVKSCKNCILSARFNKFGLTNLPGLTNRFLTSLSSHISLLHKNYGFSEFPGLTNNEPGANLFVKSHRHCITLSTIKSVYWSPNWIDNKNDYGTNNKQQRQ